MNLGRILLTLLQIASTLWIIVFILRGFTSYIGQQLKLKTINLLFTIASLILLFIFGIYDKSGEDEIPFQLGLVFMAGISLVFFKPFRHDKDLHTWRWLQRLIGIITMLVCYWVFTN